MIGVETERKHRDFEKGVMKVAMTTVAFAPGGIPGTVTSTGMTYPAAAALLDRNVVIGNKGCRRLFSDAAEFLTRVVLLFFLGLGLLVCCRCQIRDFAIAAQFSDSRLPAFVGAAVRICVFQNINLSAVHGGTGR